MTALSDVPAPQEVNEIAGIRNPVLRNLRITDCYHRISTAFTARTGRSANWCTFALWASRQAGSTIRGEDMLARLDAVLREGSFVLHPVKGVWRVLVRRGVFYPESRLGRIVKQVHTPFDAFERASDAVARGNRKVFEEIGLVFARYLCECPPTADNAAVDRFLNSLRPGNPPEGQDLLRTAFALYHQQSREANERRRAQMVCHANILVGLHEQTRLQPEIREAMESAPQTLAQQSRLLRLLRPLTRSFAKYTRDLTCRIVTESLMVLHLPGQTLQLSRHLDAKLPQLLEPVELPELSTILDRYTADDCGASDWSDLQQRMRYIARLFRCFQSDPVVLSDPFTAVQLSAIRSGRVPAGDL